MTSDIIIIDEPFIWVGTLNKENKVIELSKVTNQQYFLLGSDPEVMTEYFKDLNEFEVRRIDQLGKTSPYNNFGGMDLLLVNLN